MLPLYEEKKLAPPSTLLAFMNPPNVQEGVYHLEKAAEDNIISAMLDLADAYCTHFTNDPFCKNKEKAEQWYVRALGKGNTIFPLAFTRYGDFLMLEQRTEEAKNMYKIAALHGHTRGQYEYAICLLEADVEFDICEKAVDNVSRKTSLAVDAKRTTNQENKTEAIQYLCKASEKGFYAPSYTMLSKTLIEIAETAYGTVYSVGYSPLPRVMQILDLAKGCPYGTSRSWEEERAMLLERYTSVRKKCSNCGQIGSTRHPLRLCGTCNVVAYCSNVCQKRDYRDGHKFDCCPREDLFNFESVKSTFPWLCKAGWKRGGVELPSLETSNKGGRSLIQMVEDETDELYGEEDQDYDEYVLMNQMFRMRKNLETYLQKQSPQPAERKLKHQSLQRQIEQFSETVLKDYPKHQDFVVAMDARKHCCSQHNPSQASNASGPS